MRNCIFVFLFNLFALAVDAQTVRNVKATQEGQQIAIAYELECTQPAEINLFLSEDNGQTWNALKTGVSGDVGARITQGNKVIYWDVFQSKEKLVGNAFVFKVKAGEEFKTVKIGEQVWMAENLNVDYYQNGDPIPEIKDADQWSILYSGAWCNYDNDIANGEFYGKLYNWYTVNDERGLCPTGWHVPSDAEWTTLESCLGGKEIAGRSMKNVAGWKLSNSDFVTSIGLNFLPGGYRSSNGGFYDARYSSLLWSSSEEDYEGAWNRRLDNNEVGTGRYYLDKKNGFSVRCVRD